MSVRIRLRRVGRKKQPYFRVVVVKRDAPRDGAYIEELGFYNPRTRPAFLTMDLEKLDQWIQNGAEISDSVKSLARKARQGGDDDVVFTAPGEEPPRLKTAKKPERRPKAKATAEAADDTEATVEEATEEAAEQVEAAEEIEAAEPAEETEAAEAPEEAETESEPAEASAPEAEEDTTEEPEGDAEEAPEAAADEDATAKADDAEASADDEATAEAEADAGEDEEEKDDAGEDEEEKDEDDK